ncbi:hypothetical protein BS47DRAFT_1352187 [Hydnum rufescens UP504]|uniref:Protein YOP1 n=1 Tax=Hydnum rufescens UP504 TaxID=1448309 RepID=A0A9P6DQV9_9AGAM|nr:hypothetical protein BS47DRAFT_1352187 [Hydnum rufescens UP504]
MSSVKTHPAVQQILDKVNYYIAQLDKEVLCPVPPVRTDNTSPQGYAVLGVVFLLFLSLFINAFALPVSNLVGWALPAYYSVKALDTPGHEDDIQWLTYWVVFGSFTFVESFALRAVLYYLPFYFVFKTLFIVWLQLPGARTLYNSVLRPLVANASKAPTSSGTVPRSATNIAADLRAQVNSATEE